MIPKPSRETDKSYLAYVKTGPCLITQLGLPYSCQGDIVPHHTRTRKAGGSDFLAIPLCGHHHYELHSPNMGNRQFQIKFNLDFQQEIIKLLIGYIKEIHEEKENLRVETKLWIGKYKTVEKKLLSLMKKMDVDYDNLPF